jgi:hypothetical protein
VGIEGKLEVILTERFGSSKKPHRRSKDFGREIDLTHL